MAKAEATELIGRIGDSPMAWHPDAFCLDLYAADPPAVEAILAYQGSILRPPRPLEATQHALAGCCPRFAARVRARGVSS